MPAFFKNLGASFRWDPPPWGLGVGQQCVVGVEGKRNIPCAKGAASFFPYILVCVGQLLSGWLPPSPPPSRGGGSSAVHACQKWVPSFPFCPPPPPPVAKKSPGHPRFPERL